MNWIQRDEWNVGASVTLVRRVINRLASIKIIVGIFSDVDVQKPDEKSIMTYIAQFLKAYPEMGSDKPMVSLSTNPPPPPPPTTPQTQPTKKKKEFFL